MPKKNFRPKKTNLKKKKDHHLDVALGAQGSRLDEGLVVVDAAAVHVDAGVDVVQGIADTVEIFEDKGELLFNMLFNNLFRI